MYEVKRLGQNGRGLWVARIYKDGILHKKAEWRTKKLLEEWIKKETQ